MQVRVRPVWGAGVSWIPTSVVTGVIRRQRGMMVSSRILRLRLRNSRPVFFLNLELGTCSGKGPSGLDLLWITSKGLILAQNERWRRGLGMQVGRSARGVA